MISDTDNQSQPESGNRISTFHLASTDYAPRNDVLFNNLKPISRKGILRCRIRAVYLHFANTERRKGCHFPIGGREVPHNITGTYKERSEGILRCRIRAVYLHLANTERRKGCHFPHRGTGGGTKKDIPPQNE